MLAVAERDQSQRELDAWDLIGVNHHAGQLTRDLHAFSREAWSVVEPGTKFIDNWHLRLICRELEAVARGDVDQSIINQPPGTCKTRLLLFWTAQLLAQDPRRRILIATYGRDLSTKFAGDIRTLMRSEWFQRFFPIRFKADQDEKAYFATIDGGWCLATSIEGQGQGLHPDFIILDDPLKALEAMTVAGRDAVWNWYRNTLATRGVTRKVRVVASGQRLDADDFFGRLLASPNASTWRQRSFPMRYEKARPATDVEPKGYTPDPEDPRTEEGQLLWPELIPEDKVRKMELDLAEDAPAQLQQQPRVKGGRLFKIDMLRFYEPGELPREMVWRRGWDTAATENGGDYTVGVRMGAEIGEVVENGVRKRALSGRYFIPDVARDQLAPDGVDRLMRMTAETDGVRCGQREEREGGSSGKAVTNARSRLMRGFDYEEVTKHTNKVVYSKPFRAQVNAGNVYLPKGAAWVAAFVKELAEFPGGKNDDQVDGASTAFNALVEADLTEAVECTW